MNNETASSQRPADPPLLRSTSSGRGDCIPTVFCGRGGSVEFAEEHVAGSSQETDDGHLTAETTFPQAVDCDLKGAQIPTTIQCTELVRAVLKVSTLPGAFRRFVGRSMTEFRIDDEGPVAPRSDLWPCPPPRWRRWTPMQSLSPRRRKRHRLLETKALCVQQLVLALNWLTLGHAHSPPVYARAGYPMSAQQLAMVERLENLVEYYLGAPTAALDSLGRAGEKLTKLAQLAFKLKDPSDVFSVEDLSSFLQSIQNSFEPYSRNRQRAAQAYEPQPGTYSKDKATAVEPETRVASSSCAAMPVVANRIKWKLAPAFDPTPYLTDPIVKRAFADPNVLRRPERDWPRLPKAKVHADRDQIWQLAEKWDALHACSLVACEMVQSAEAVGLFAVPKDSEYDRLILNPTVVNSRSFSYASFAKTIAPGYLMSLVRIPQDENLLVSSDDLCEFYYTFKVSPSRARRNAIGVRFKGSDFAGFSCYSPALHDKEVYVCLSTLAMGDALAVEIAQQSHVNVLRNLASCMQLHECLLYRQPVPRGPFFELLTIDDHIGLQRVKKDGSLPELHSRDLQVFKAANEAYNHVNLTAHPGKMRRRDEHAVVLGAEIDGRVGRCSAPRERVALLSFITSIVIHKRLATRKLLQGLIGCWTHALLFRRPIFSILDAVYHEGETLNGDVLFRISDSCRTELMLLCLLAPAMQTDLRAEVASELYTLDASPYGGGVCHAAFSTFGAEELWRRTEQKGFYTRLQSDSGATLRELGIEHAEFFGNEERQSLFSSSPYAQPELVSLRKSVLQDHTLVSDCIELFSGQGNWSRCHAAAGLQVHPGIERSATGKFFGDLSDNNTFRELAYLAYHGAIREWHAGPPCWSFGTLRRPRLRSKDKPAGFDMTDGPTREQTLLAIRTAFLLTLACLSGSFVSAEQPGGSVMFLLAAFQRLLTLGCRITKFCFCSFGTGFMKPSKWLHNKPWYDSLAGKCRCRYKNNHFTVQGTFTRSSIRQFDHRCNPDTLTVYGRQPMPGEAVSRFSASYPIPLCQVMASGSSAALKGGIRPQQTSRGFWTTADDPEGDEGPSFVREWCDDPLWVEDICESLPFKELFRYKFKRGGHINCLECRVYKSWLKHCSKKHPRCRIVSFLDSRVTMGAAAKGRSSSKALSRILRTSLGYIVGGCLYPGALHCRSSWNRADGPSRDGVVPGPSRPIPDWLCALRDGDARLFDQVLVTAKWTRPVGRWIRLLLLLAGDIEQNPGPPLNNLAGSNYAPRGELNLLGGFATATTSRMKKCLDSFKCWLLEQALSFEDVSATADAMNLALRAYGLALFREGKPRYLLVYAITAIQQIFPEFRRQLAGAWQIDMKWQNEEPGQCRAVLSAPILRALLTVALIWNWFSFAGSIALGFGGTLHPSELLGLTRRDLIFPEDALTQQPFLYIYIKNPKTARFARRQHARIDDVSLIFLVRCIFGSLPLSSKLFPASTAVFRRQWNGLCDHLGIPRRQADRGATPGVLRGSGATHEYLETSNIAQIQWKGRWSRIKTLEYYIQEVGAQLFLYNLPVETRRRISLLESHLIVVLKHVFPEQFHCLCRAG